MADKIHTTSGQRIVAMNLNRKAYGFEIKKDFYKLEKEKVLSSYIPNMFCEDESGENYEVTSETLFKD